jgi:hypothetical protein
MWYSPSSSSFVLFFLLPQVLETVNEKKGVVSVNLDLGAHHLDLFFPDDEGRDPPCATQARALEKGYIQAWIAGGEEKKRGRG